jgi:hypothetical protein
VHTNLRDGSMAYANDGEAFNPHVNYEPPLVHWLGGCDKAIQERAVGHFARCRTQFGEQVAAGVGMDVKSLDIEELTSPR